MDATLRSLLAGVLAHPGEESRRLITADYLEELGDPRGEQLRRGLACMVNWRVLNYDARVPVPDVDVSPLACDRVRLGGSWTLNNFLATSDGDAMALVSVVLPNGDRLLEDWIMPRGGVVEPNVFYNSLGAGLLVASTGPARVILDLDGGWACRVSCQVWLPCGAAAPAWVKREWPAEWDGLLATARDAA